jgi:hypothetical protein
MSRTKNGKLHCALPRRRQRSKSFDPWCWEWVQERQRHGRLRSPRDFWGTPSCIIALCVNPKRPKRPGRISKASPEQLLSSKMPWRTATPGYRQQTLTMYICFEMSTPSLIRPFHTILDFLRAFPQAKLVLTDRNITAWYNRRMEFCDNTLSSSVCDAPFVLRPLQLHMNHQKEGHTQLTAVVLTRQQAIGAYQATRDVLSCLIDPEHILRMNVWESPPPTIIKNDDNTNQSSASPWFAVLAHFLNRTLLPDESQCNHIPNAGHALRSLDKTENMVDPCEQWARKHPDWFGKDTHTLWQP